MKKLWRRLFGSPQYERLKNALDEYEIKLHHRIDRQPFVAGSPWAKAAKECLGRARQALEESLFDSGWQHLHTAQSLEIWVFTDDEVRTAREAACREATKLAGWRKGTIESLVCCDPASPNPANGELQRRELYQATLIRNEQFNNLYHKIRVRARSLKVAFFVLAVIVTAAPLLALVFRIQAVNWKMLAAVEFFGVLGAALSVASSLTRSSVDASIPQQVLASVVTWMRPAIGAGAALAAYLFLKAGLVPALKPASTVSALVIAFVAGFSERFITGAVEDVVPNEKK
ncbi:MAG: hypothetical protein ACXWID_06920 [Pyrinomonadaceae bacterium]